MALEKTEYPLTMWLYILHSDINRCHSYNPKLTTKESLKEKSIKDELKVLTYEVIICNNDTTNLAKLLLITKAIGYINPFVINKYNFDFDPTKVDRLILPPGKLALKLTEELFCAPNDANAINVSASALMDIYNPILKDLLLN